MKVESKKDQKCELPLTDFQLASLSQLAQVRQRAVKEEHEFVGMCIKAAGMTIEEGSFVEVKDGKLKWSNKK